MNFDSKPIQRYYLVEGLSTNAINIYKATLEAVIIELFKENVKYTYVHESFIHKKLKKVLLKNDFVKHFLLCYINRCVFGCDAPMFTIELLYGDVKKKKEEFMEDLLRVGINEFLSKLINFNPNACTIPLLIDYNSDIEED